VIPQSWQGFAATRKFRGVTYRINVKRVGPGNRVSLIVGGKPIGGNTVLASEGQTEVSVDVTLS